MQTFMNKDFLLQELDVLMEKTIRAMAATEAEVFAELDAIMQENA